MSVDETRQYEASQDPAGQSKRPVKIPPGPGPIRYASDGTWLPLPTWASGLLDLGRLIAGTGPGPARTVLAVAAPIRSYAAALLATGAVAEWLRKSCSVNTGLAGRLEMLKAMPMETPVWLRSAGGGTKTRGVFVGFTDINGEQMLGVRVVRKSAGGTTDYIPVEDAHRIEPCRRMVKKLPKRPNVRPDTGEAAFIRAVVQAETDLVILPTSQLNCLIIGNVSALRYELCARSFGVSQGMAGTVVTGALQEIVRARRFQPRGQAYCADVIRSTGRKLPHLTHSEPPRVVVFDGASGFLKWQERFGSSNWIVVLDQTEARFEEAAELLNEEYASRIDSDGTCPPLAATVPGVESMVFQEGLT